MIPYNTSCAEKTQGAGAFAPTPFSLVFASYSSISSFTRLICLPQVTPMQVLQLSMCPLE